MPIEIATPAGAALVDLDRPVGARGLLVLGHGAGGGVDAPDLLAARGAGTAAGFAVARVTQPYRVLGRRSPAPARVLDTSWAAVVAAMRRRRGLGALPLVVGGRSSGARVACRTADELGAAGVLALAFPLHPPARARPSSAGRPPSGRPEMSRLDELELPRVPVLVIQGERDPFGVPAPAHGRTVIVVPMADHSLKRAAATQAVRESLALFFDQLAGA
jgi:predicted alpha/beta-hydrolase family hydrolase